MINNNRILNSFKIMNMLMIFINYKHIYNNIIIKNYA